MMATVHVSMQNEILKLRTSTFILMVYRGLNFPATDGVMYLQVVDGASGGVPVDNHVPHAVSAQLTSGERSEQNGFQVPLFQFRRQLQEKSKLAVVVNGAHSYRVLGVGSMEMA